MSPSDRESGPILVAGGAGYIGSCCARILAASGRAVAVLDDLSSGHPEAIPGLPLLRADLTDRAGTAEAVARVRPSAVMLFAGLISVPESVREPEKYYRVNLGGALNLLEAMTAAGVRRLVFSSSAAVYGVPGSVPIPEDAPKSPINPYGRIKLQIEEALGDLAAAGRLQAVSLRYFNAAGAEEDGSFGEAHEPEAHLVPLAIAAGLGRIPPLRVFGDDYPTPDGSCVRDYVHVRDLARAHLLALDRLDGGGPALAYNLGVGEGYSVFEVIRAVSRELGREVPFAVAPRRPGDPPRLVASSERIRRDLGWVPEHDLASIVETAARWHRAHPRGYRPVI
ncbi:MAG: UDP-glucose 4-epimerase GalE [Planctomycetes bacterium]|nr:UDP-glucose 4-epimerase GalE [Planctomycetota bacterium]